MRRVRLSTEASYEHLFSFEVPPSPRGANWACATTAAATGRPAPAWRSARGLRYRYLPQGLTIKGYGRRLVVHEGAVRESGFGAGPARGSGRVGPRPVHERDPRLGRDGQRRTNQLWERGASGFIDVTTHAWYAHERATSPTASPRFNGGGLLTPFGALILAGEARAGLRARRDSCGGPRPRLSVSKPNAAGALPPRAIYAVMLRGMLQF